MSNSKSDSRRTEIQEALATLYLRLNGYFCLGNYLHHLARVEESGLISESDVLAIRMPYQEEVLINGPALPNDSSVVLAEPDVIDCVIAEVKTSKVEFNKPITRESGINVIMGAVRMFGVLPRDEFQGDRAARRLAVSLHQQVRAPRWPDVPRSIDEKYQLSVRMLVFATRPPDDNQRKCVTLQHALDFVRDRLHFPCAGYSRAGNEVSVSPWRGCTKLIVDVLDEHNDKLELERFTEQVLSRWDSR
jgi:hypothetical protein